MTSSVSPHIRTPTGQKAGGSPLLSPPSNYLMQKQARNWEEEDETEDSVTVCLHKTWGVRNENLFDNLDTGSSYIYVEQMRDDS